MIFGKPITLTNNTGSTIPAFSLVAPGATTGTMVLADLVTNPGIIGTTTEDVANGASGLVAPFGLTTWMRFATAPSIGSGAWLSTTTGKAQSTIGISSFAAAQQVTVRLGTVTKISSTDSTLAQVVPSPRNSAANASLFGDRFFGPGSWFVYAVDYDGIVLPGNDTTGNPGASNTMAAALSSALLRPFKTLERVGQCLPRAGNNANIVVLVRPRAGGAPYRNMANSADQAMDWCQGMSNCAQFIRRGTLDFANDLNDKIVCGFLNSANAGGYNPTAGATASSLPCQLAGGGAAGLPGESADTGFSPISGFRIRFSATTTTVALRNATAMVWKNTSNVIIPSIDLPAVPGTSDVFFLEQAGVVVGDASNDYLGLNDLSVTAGFRSNIGRWNYNCPGKSYLAGCEGLSFATGGPVNVAYDGDTHPNGVVLADGFYLDETTTPIFVGVSLRVSAGSTQIITARGARLQNHFTSTRTIFALSESWMPNFNSNADSGFCGGSLSPLGIEVSRIPGTGFNASTFPTFVVGSYLEANIRRFRLTDSDALSGISFLNCGGSVYGIDISNQTVASAINIIGLGLSIAIDDVVSPDGGNSSPILNLADVPSGWRKGAYSCELLIGQAVEITATSTGGDISLPGGGVRATFAGLSTTNYRDVQGNNIIGDAGVLIKGTRTMNALAALPAFSVVRSTGISDQIAGAQADTAAHCTSVFGVTITDLSGAGATIVAGPGEIVPILFTAPPTVGNIAYVSTTVNLAQDTPPAASGTNQKLALGRVVAANGNVGYVAFEPELQPTPSNGATGDSKFLFNWVFSGNPDVSGNIPTWLSQSNFDAGPASAIEFPVDEPVTKVLVEGWLPAYGWGSSFPTLKLTKNGSVVATAYAVASGTAGVVQFAIVTQAYARGDRLGLQLGSFGGGAIAGTSLFTGRVFVIP